MVVYECVCLIYVILLEWFFFVYVIVTLLFVYFISYLTEWLYTVISNCFYECVTVVMYGYYQT